MKISYQLLTFLGLLTISSHFLKCRSTIRPINKSVSKTVTAKCPKSMPRKTTFAMIKPDAVKAKNMGKIIDMIERNNFDIVHMRQMPIPENIAKEHYGDLKEKPFFGEIIEFITSGPSVVMALEKENAVQDWRKLMGPTDPKKAEPGTIRKKFGTDVMRNAVHGSDSPESASKELARFFPKYYK